MLAIHLYREIYDSGFKPNKQDHVTPVLATALKAEVNKKSEPPASDQVSISCRTMSQFGTWRQERAPCHL